MGKRYFLRGTNAIKIIQPQCTYPNMTSVLSAVNEGPFIAYKKLNSSQPIQLMIATYDQPRLAAIIAIISFATDPIMANNIKFSIKRIPLRSD